MLCYAPAAERKLDIQQTRKETASFSIEQQNTANIEQTSNQTGQ